MTYSDIHLRRPGHEEDYINRTIEKAMKFTSIETIEKEVKEYEREQRQK